LTACIVRFWIMPLFSSLWVDEMATVFVVRHGGADATLRVAPQVPASIYYSLPRLAQSLMGGTEVAWRLPSVVALAVALWFISRLARRLIHPAAAWFAVFACLALPELNEQAAEARPYALGACAAAAGCWFLVRWLDTARWQHAACFAAAAALLWRIHLVLWPFYPVFALYFLARMIPRRTRVAWGSAAAVFAAVGIALIPVAREALALSRSAAAHVIASPPSLTELATSLRLSLVMSCCAVAALVSRWRMWPAGTRLPSMPSTVLILAWWLCPPLALFGFSYLTGNSLFVSRYLVIALPGVALAATAGAAAFVPARHWRTFAIATGLIVLAFGGRWARAVPLHHGSDWRGAARALNHAAAPDSPVICPSPFVEAQSPVWRPEYPLASFLYSNLLVYRIRGRELPFPYQTSPEAESYAAVVSAALLVPARRFFLYGGNGNVTFWRTWFRARPELAQWRERSLGSFGEVAVVEFDNPAAQAALP
jgi:mannosyltransferase